MFELMYVGSTICPFSGKAGTCRCMFVVLENRAYILMLQEQSGNIPVMRGWWAKGRMRLFCKENICHTSLWWRVEITTDIIEVTLVGYRTRGTVSPSSVSPALSYLGLFFEPVYRFETPEKAAKIENRNKCTVWFSVL